jgi:geranyl-CoA carboxylase beta subunit
VIARLADGSDFLDFKPGYGPMTVCAEASVMGHPVGFIANNGVLDNAGSGKATHFIQRCTMLGTPLVFLQNINGYMVGVDAERGGMIKNGSKMIQAVSNADVPRFTLMIGASFGAGNYGMCGVGYDPRLVLTWPNARAGVMGGEQAAGTMRVVAEERAARKGEPVDEEAMEAFAKQIVDLYSAQESAFVTSGRQMDDGMIDPRDSRKVLGFGLAMAKEGDSRKVNPLSFGVGRI